MTLATSSTYAADLAGHFRIFVHLEMFPFVFGVKHRPSRYERTLGWRLCAMPTYFFDLLKGNELVEDDQGDDLADIEAAKLEGLASARELIIDAAKKGILATSPVYCIRNEAGDILATIPFKDALKPS